MEKLLAGVVEYEPLPHRYPSETYSKYVQRNVTEYERIVGEAVTEVWLTMMSDNATNRWITNKVFQAVNVLVFPEYGLTGLVDRFLSREELKALVKGQVHACLLTLISLAFLEANL